MSKCFTPLVRHALLGVAGLLGVFASIAAARDVEKLSPRIRLDAAQRNVVDGYWKSHHAIRSGECEITEERKGKLTRRMNYAFELDQNHGRYDTEDIGRRKYRLILTPEEMMIYVAGSHVLSKYPRSQSIPLPRAIPADLKTIIFAGGGFEEAHTPYKELMRDWGRMRPVAVVRDDATPNHWTITFLRDYEIKQPSGKPTVQARAWYVVKLDESLEYRPLKIEWFFKFDYVRSEWTLELDGRLHKASEFVWKKSDGVLVPTRVSYAYASDKEKTKIEFAWKSVNKPIPERYLSVDDLQLAPGTAIVNEQKGPGFIESRVPGDPQK